MENEVVKDIEIVKTLLLLHHRSLIEFRREDRLMICDKDFTIQQVTVPDIRRYLDANKALIQTAERIVNRKE